MFTQPLRETTVSSLLLSRLSKAASLVEGKFGVSSTRGSLLQTAVDMAIALIHRRKDYSPPVWKKSSKFTLKQSEPFEVSVNRSCLDMPLNLCLATHNKGHQGDKTSLFAPHSPETAL